MHDENINGITFNTIVRNKLYSRDKVLRHMYGCSAEKSRLLSQHFTYNMWKRCKKSCVNAENFNPELVQDQTLFEDSVTLAYKMNEYVNLAWSKRRLKEEHDKWSKEYTEISFELTNRKLIIHPVFTQLNECFNGGMLTTTKELAIEGMTQKHCVATYSANVDNGRCAIFHIEGYTAEVRNTGKQLYLAQFKGYRNKQAPEELQKRVEAKIIEFNKIIQEQDLDTTEQEQAVQLLEEYVPLPF